MKINVSNLDLSVNKSDLQELFEEFGEVSSIRILSPYQNKQRSKMAIVEMDDVLSAMEAIEDLNGELYMGRHISVQPESRILSAPKQALVSQSLDIEKDEYEDMWEAGYEKIKKKDYSKYLD